MLPSQPQNSVSAKNSWEDCVKSGISSSSCSSLKNCLKTCDQHSNRINWEDRTRSNWGDKVCGSNRRKDSGSLKDQRKNSWSTKDNWKDRREKSLSSQNCGSVGHQVKNSWSRQACNMLENSQSRSARN